MPYYSATTQRIVREIVVVEAKSLDHARELIDEESDETITISDNETDPEIVPGSLQEASPEEIKRYKRYYV